MHSMQSGCLGGIGVWDYGPHGCRALGSLGCGNFEFEGLGA